MVKQIAGTQSLEGYTGADVATGRLQDRPRGKWYTKRITLVLRGGRSMRGQAGEVPLKTFEYSYTSQT